jgi:aminoglycoside 3-N-acetyltransferase
MTGNYLDTSVSPIIIKEVLSELGLSEGNAVYVHSALGGFGAIEGIDSTDRLGYCKAIYGAIDDCISIGASGTLFVPTFTHGYVKEQTDFNLKKTPSEAGIFSEYVRCLPQSTRSLHPVASNAAVGKMQSILDHVSISSFGMGSFFDKFVKIENSSVLWLGASINHTTYVHHVEQIVGVSYVYNKAYFKPRVFTKDEGIVNHPFYNTVRYLDRGVVPDYSILELTMKEKGVMQSTRINNCEIMCAKTMDLVNVIYEMIQDDSTVFLKNPVYVTE